MRAALYKSSLLGLLFISTLRAFFYPQINSTVDFFNGKSTALSTVHQRHYQRCINGTINGKPTIN